jgi:hypothetical protein
LLVDFCTDGIHQWVDVLELCAEVEIAIMAGLPTEGDVDV